MVYLKYNSVKLPVLDNYNIAKSSQELTFSDIKCDFTGHQKADLPEKYQEVRVVEESKANREIEKIEYEEKKDVKELSFESKVREKISICKVHGYSKQETRSGKNLANITKHTNTLDAGTTIIDSNTYQLNLDEENLTTKSWKGSITLKFENLKKNTDYVVSFKYTDGYNTYTKIQGDSVTIIEKYISGYPDGLSFNTGENNVVNVTIYANGSNANATGIITISEIQIEKGAVKTDYEPYGAMPSTEFRSEIRNCGDNINILKLINTNKTINGVEFTVNKDGSITAKGTATEQAIYLINSTEILTFLESMPKGNYVFSGGISSDAYIQIYTDKASSTGQHYFSSKSEPLNINIDIDVSYTAYIVVKSGVTINDTFYPKLEKGTKATPYTPYGTGSINIKIENEDETKEQDFTFPLSEGQRLYKDSYLADDGIYHKRKQRVLDGTENTWNINVNYTTDDLLVVSVHIKDIKASTINVLSSHFKYNKTSATNTFYIIGKYLLIRLDRTKFDTLDTFKTYLAEQKANGTPVMIEYELAQEEVEIYTEEQQKAWNNMQNLVSYVGINNINSSTNIDVKYPVRIKKEIVPETYDKLLCTGYIDDYVFDEMRELDEDINISFTLLSPQKIATLRTCIAVGTYEIKDLIENIILAPLIDDGFILKTLEITDRKITVNYLCKTIEYCLNNLSNKFNFWWYIDENKNIYFKDIELLYSEDNIEHVYDDENKIPGLEYIKPTVSSENYANVVNFTNVRIYEQSDVVFEGKNIVESYNPIIEQQISTLKQNDQIEFLYPVDFKKENIIKSAESTSVYLSLLYGLYITGKYSDNTTFVAYYGYDKESEREIKTNNIGYEGNNADSEKEFLVIKDSFFSNLITGIKYNGTKAIKEITEIKSHSALIWNIYKFYNDKGIEEKKNKISKTGIVETTVNMNESWKTIQEIEDIGSSYIEQNSLKFDGQIELKTDQNIFNVGETIKINKYMGSLLIKGVYIVTQVDGAYENNEFEYIITCKNSNMLSNFIDIFRGEDTQESSDKTYKLYVTHYNEEEISESHEVVQ